MLLFTFSKVNNGDSGTLEHTAAQVKSQFEGSLDYVASLELAEVTYQVTSQ